MEVSKEEYEKIISGVLAGIPIEQMRSVRELLFENSQREKTLKRFLEYCYMIDVKVAFEGLKGEKTKGLKAALKFAKEHDMCMTEAQIQGAK